MPSQKQSSGFIGEDLAVDFLKKKGYKIIKRNFRIIGGEIDIIAIDKGTLVFIEVKARNSSRFGYPLEAITVWKMKSLIKTAQVFKLKNPGLPDAMRIDAVAIIFAKDQKAESIELVKNINI